MEQFEAYDMRKHGTVIEIRRSPALMMLISGVFFALIGVVILGSAFAEGAEQISMITVGVLSLIGGGVLLYFYFTLRFSVKQFYRSIGFFKAGREGKVAIGTIISVSTIERGKDTKNKKNLDIKYIFVDDQGRRRVAKAHQETLNSERQNSFVRLFQTQITDEASESVKDISEAKHEFSDWRKARGLLSMPVRIVFNDRVSALLEILDGSEEKRSGKVIDLCCD